MPSNQNICLGQVQACAIRVVRLGTNCAPLVGANNAVYTTALVSGTFNADMQEAQTFEQLNACGEIIFRQERPSKLRGYNAELTIGTWDYELEEMLTGGTLLLGAAGSVDPTGVIGFADPGTSTADPNGVSLEIWTKVGSSTGACSPIATDVLYTRHVFPRVILSPGNKTFESGILNMALSGYAGPNPQWGTGAYNDWPATAEIPDDSPHAEVQVADLPALTAGCGYQDVPAS